MKYYPWSDSFFALSMMGFIIALFLTYRGRLGLDIGVSLTLLFAIFFFASLLSVRSSVYRHE